MDVFTDVLDKTMQTTQYATVVSDYQTGVVGQDDGTNPLRVAVYAVPTLLAIVRYKIINYRDDTVINICVNMSIISTCLYLISMVTSGIFIGRLPIYFSLYNLILLPWEIRYMFTDRSRPIVLVLCVVLYLVFYYYQMFIVW